MRSALATLACFLCTACPDSIPPASGDVAPVDAAVDTASGDDASGDARDDTGAEVVADVVGPPDGQGGDVPPDVNLGDVGGDDGGQSSADGGAETVTDVATEVGNDTGTGSDTGVPVAGETCATAIAIGALPFSSSGDTTGMTSDYDLSVCNGVDTTVGPNAPDVVYSFTPSATGLYLADLTNFATNPPYLLSVTSDCSGAGGAAACAGWVDVQSSALAVTLTAGTTYYFIIDSFDAEAGPFTFTLEESCIPDCAGQSCGTDLLCGLSCGTCEAGEGCDASGQCVDVSATVGDSCFNPKDLGALPASVSGDTSVGLVNAHAWLPGTCTDDGSESGAAAPDEVWQLEATADGTYTVTLSSPTDQGIYIFSDCADPNATCLAGADEFFGGTDESFTVSLTAGTYFIVVDGYVDGESGPYTLTVPEPCIPTCGAAVCGSDGCGGSCGACPSGEFCLDGACGVVSGGDTCADALVIDPAALPYAFSFGTTALGNDYQTADDQCAGVGSVGGASNDAVFSLTPSETAYYEVVVAGFDSATYVTSDCADLSAGCVGGVDAIGESETVSVLLEAGTEYFIVVDGWSGSSNIAGDFDISVTLSCVPSCANKVCGNDGCGGQCGTCPSGEVCNAAEDGCEPLGGDTCADPMIVPGVPFTQLAETSTATDSLELLDGACGTSGWGAASNDRVYAFTPTTTAYYPVDVVDQDFDHVMYITTSCGDVDVDSCLAASDFDPQELLMVAGTTYYIIVDGWSDSSNQNGNYTMTVGEATCTPSCAGQLCGDDGCGGDCLPGCNPGQQCQELDGTCLDIPGDACETATALVVGTQASGDTADAAMADDYQINAADCGGPTAFGSGSDDMAWTFTPDADGAYTFTLAPSGGWTGALAVVRSCSDIPETCAGAVEGASDNSAVALSVPLVGGVTYYLIVDGSGSSDGGTYTLDVTSCSPDCASKSCGDDTCGGTCGPGCATDEYCDAAFACVAAPEGNTCADAITVGALPYAHTGDTSQGTNDYFAPDGVCGSSGYGGGSDDIAYALTPTETGYYDIEVDAQGFNASVYIVTDCGSLGTSCMASDSSGAIQGILLDAATTYYIVVDGLSNAANSAGAYTLTVGAPCVPDCSTAQCGNDGCGFTCGVDCAAGQICNANQCIAETGDTCAEAIVLEPSGYPIEVSGSTATATNSLGFGDDTCKTGTGYGGSSPERAHSFTPTVSGLYDITLSASWDEQLYVVTDCDTIDATTCIGESDPGTLTLELQAGTTYFIIADGWNSDDDSGDYTLTIEEPCVPQCGAAVCGLDPACGASCGDCGSGFFCQNGACEVEAGDTCGDAIVIDPQNLPASILGNTDSATASYSFGDDTCQPGGGYDGASPDRAHSFTPDVTGLYDINMDGLGGWDEELYVVTDCDTIDATTCLGASDPGDISLPLDAGTTYFIIVDGWSNSTPDSGDYQLTVSAPCVFDCSAQDCGPDPLCGAVCGTCGSGEFCDASNACVPLPGGDSCADSPQEIPYSGGSGAISGNTDSYNPSFDASACNSPTWNGAGANDIIHQFTAAGAGDFTFTLTPDVTTFDATLYVLDGPTCDASAACLGYDDQFSDGGEVVTLTLTAGQVVWVVVDGWSATSNQSGDYELTVSGP